METSSDGELKIDYVLVYREPVDKWRDIFEPHVRLVGHVSTLVSLPHPIPDTRAEILRQRRQYRQIYQRRLIEAGLKIRIVSAHQAKRRYFVLVHAPSHILEKHSDIIGLKKKMNKWTLPDYKTTVVQFFRFFMFWRQEEPEPHSNEQQQQPGGWSLSDRALVVRDLLARTNYGPHHENEMVGLQSMLNQNIYTTAYPLHEPSELARKLSKRKESVGNEEGNDDEETTEREWLSFHWASFFALFMQQPLDVVRSYFGPQIALYFVFFGSYISWLVLASLPSVIFRLFSTWQDGASHKLNILSERVIPRGVCQEYRNATKEILICPQCSLNCDFESLTHICDHPLALVYTSHSLAPLIHSMIICIWAAIFVQYLRRQEARFVHRWFLMDNVYDEEMLRPEFVRANVKRHTFNAITGRKEPAHSKLHRLSVLSLQTLTIVLMVVMILGVNFGCLLLKYHIRSAMLHILNHPLDRFTIIGAAIVAALVHSGTILLLNWISQKTCLWIVEWENPKTQRAFDDQYSKMIFIFEFLDYFAPLFYIVFVRTMVSIWAVRFGSESNLLSFNGPWVKWFVDTCSYTCMEELDQAMIVFFCFTQIFREIFKAFWIWVYGVFRRVCLRSQKGCYLPPWERDFFLPQFSKQQLCYDHLRLIIQFSFVVLFSASFPFAPFLALIVNIICLRADAIKWTKMARRATPKMAPSIGIWMKLLNMIATFAVPFNGFVLAFTTDIVPRLVYVFKNFHNATQYGLGAEYFDFVYARFDTRNMTISRSMHKNVTECRFYGMYKTPCSLAPEDDTCSNTVERSPEFLQIFFYRVFFMSCFINTVFGVTWFLKLMFPAEPESVKLAKKQEQFKAQQALAQVQTMSTMNLALSMSRENLPCDQRCLQRRASLIRDEPKEEQRDDESTNTEEEEDEDAE
ncbi:unnamed protein product, partial [Mesorhabditis belari]|uniref:Anoctamin n=1 Tax=Mesorhabditis belari TaxID=2138241 RepID=A0AAF3ENM2_9BILA